MIKITLICALVAVSLSSVASECKDWHWNCKTWQQREGNNWKNVCERVKFVKDNCQKTCGACSGGGPATQGPWTRAPWTRAPWTRAPWTRAPWTRAPWTSGPRTSDPGPQPTWGPGKTTKPVECNSSNKGHCECGSKSQGFTTYVLKVDGTTRCFTIYQPVQDKKQPVVLSSNCYAKDRLQGIKMMSDRIDDNVAAKRYGYARIGLSTPDGGWSFGNDGVVNDQNPRPCADKDSKDIPYLKAVFEFVESQPQRFDSSKVYAEGFSQNSMFSAYIGFCFPEKVVGIWQGGSGMALTGQRPFLPGCEGQVRASIFKKNKPCQRAIQSHPCKECQYWPIYPCFTEKRPMIDCVSEYTNDYISVDRQDSSKDSGRYMYDKLVAEGHDGRFMQFSPTNGVRGGHSNPQNAPHWQVGCLGITRPCSGECEQAFVNCVGSQGASGFRNCISVSSFSKLTGCSATCSPTLNMLKTSETPKTLKLSKGTFGATNNAAPKRPSTSKCQA